MTLRRYIVLAVAVLLSGCATVAGPVTENPLLVKMVASDVGSDRVPLARFRQAEADLEYAPTNKDRCLKKWRKTNEAAILAWCESYVLSDLIDRVEYADDPEAAQLFIEHASRIMAGYDPRSRDPTRRNRHTAGWVSKRYSEGKPSYWLVHTGQIIRNFARFAVVVRDRGLQRYAKDANKYAKIARSFFLSYEVDWDGKRYHYPGKRDRSSPSETALPLNMQATFGITAIHLYRYFRQKRFLNRARRLSRYTMRYFKILVDKKGVGVTWPYSEATSTEDTSHAILTLSFVHLAMTQKIGFTEEIYRAIVKSFASRALKRGSTLSHNIRGQHPGTGGRVDRNCYRLMHIARFNRKLFAICDRVAKQQAMRRNKRPARREVARE